MSELRTVAALYVDPRGPYPRMDGVDCWDEQRDARSYEGPHPVVAHPPCGPYGRLRHLCTKQDASCAPRALEQVRAFGGVLEHPKSSRLWEAYDLPQPGALPDAYGGVTIAVEQVRWGHVARKRTWLYLVGVRDAGKDPPSREPTHWIGGGRQHTGSRTPVPAGILCASSEQARRTPPAFAQWLVQLARSARV